MNQHVCETRVFPVGHSDAAASGALSKHCRHHRLEICEATSDSRSQVEQFIRTAFANEHGALVNTFMPTLLALRGDDEQLCGVVGLRPAAQGPLFLERYLDEPIERVLSCAVRRNIERCQIVEVGNLAGLNCRAASRLMFALPEILLSRGHDWIVFTATDGIRKLLNAYRAPVLELARARAECVAESTDVWGRYYQRDPRVLAAHLPAAVGLGRTKTMLEPHGSSAGRPMGRRQ